MQYHVVDAAQFSVIQTLDRPNDEGNHLLPQCDVLAFRALLIHVQIPFRPGAEAKFGQFSLKQ